MASSVIKKPIVAQRVAFTATTSSYGNASLASYIDVTKNIIVGISAWLSSKTTSLVVCTPYSFRTTSSDTGYIYGIHCIGESDSIIANTEISGYIYYIAL